MVDQQDLHNSQINDSEDNSNSKDDVVDQILERVMDNSMPQISVETHGEENKSWDNINYYIQTANAKILLETLAPEVSKNEKKKREHKDTLIKYVSIFLGAQFLVVFILVMLVLISIIVFHALDNDFSQELIQMIFAFFGTYITSVIVELICILKYIVVNVFDTSISALMEAFKLQSDKKDKEQDN